MQELTLEQVKENCRKGIKEKTLGAEKGHTGCLYRYQDGCGCAIGLSLTDETKDLILKKEWNNDYLGTLIGKGVVSIPNDLDRDTLVELQILHDEWAKTTKVNEREACRELFLEAVDYVEN